MSVWLSFDQRVIGDDDQLLSYVEIGVGAHVAMNPWTLRVEDVLELVADPLADYKADNRPIRAIDQHVRFHKGHLANDVSLLASDF